ncbi:MAG: hypothetical protein CME70_09040 [Halobacteriovorax sp.]|nr:hypothetical protein [Halobacteriovorax sp.]
MDNYILGLSAFYHDSSACLIRGDEVVAAAAEERFSRKKHDPDFPISAINYCLEEAGIELKDVEKIVFYEKPFITFERIFETYLTYAPFGYTSFATSFPIWAKEKIFMKSRILDELSKLGDLPKEKINLNFSAHHLSHAAGAFYPSPFDSAAVICMDGVGEWATTTIWHGKNEKLEIKKQINFPHSIGLLYSAFTYFCGFKVNDGEYKLMGLAPYGDPIYADLIKEKLITIKDDGSYEMDMSYFEYTTGLRMTNSKFAALFGGEPRKPESDITQREMDLAASVQKVTEDIILLIAKYAKEITGEDSLCLSGGVALNCVANGKLLRSKLFDELWIQPAASDAGSALGCALAAYYSSNEVKRKVNKSDSMKGCYLGPKYTEKQIKEVLDQAGATYKTMNREELIEEVSSLIAQDKVIGWFSGRSEFGPRALGSRSILGNALSPELQRTINLKIKYRESFRPFAPAMLEDESNEYFDYVKKSPYMLLVDEVKKSHQTKLSSEEEGLKGLDRLRVARSTLPAITHVNNTARIQTVTDESNPDFFKLISAVKSKVGKGVVINTSFNVRSEPIVNSPIDALNCFMNTEMDYLVLENILLKKEDQKIQKKNESKDRTPKKMTMRELLIFWLKVYVFIQILSYVTLPFFGFKRTIYPALVALLPFFFAVATTDLLSSLTIPFKRLLKFIEGGINKVFLGIIFYLILTPYSFLMKIFVRKEASSEDTFWQEGQELLVNKRLF